MGVIGVYDWDFFNYSPMIPNLECAKLLAYHKQRRDVTVLLPVLGSLDRYSKVYIRKDYDDGLYSRHLLLNNVEYGGRFFNSVYQFSVLFKIFINI